MRAPVFALALTLTLAVPSIGLAQSDTADEGTYSTYPADDARVDLPDGYTEVETGGEERRVVSAEQQLFDVFWNELSRFGRWEEDPTYSWVWYPNETAFRPYADGSWVYTNEGWTFESESQYGWAVYHYGRWAYLSGGWAWLPGYEWSPGWVTVRVSGNYIGWAPIGPGGYVWDYWPMGWGYGYSPWLFVSINDFGLRHHRHDYFDHHRGESAYHDGRPVDQGHGQGHGGPPSWREIPNVHHAEPVRIVDGHKPNDAGAPQGGAVVIYRPRPNLSGPTVGSSGGSGGGRGMAPNRPSTQPGRPPLMHEPRPGPGMRPEPNVAPERPSAPSAPPGTRFEPPTMNPRTPHAITPSAPSNPQVQQPGPRPSFPTRQEPREIQQPPQMRPPPPQMHQAPASQPMRPTSAPEVHHPAPSTPAPVVVPPPRPQVNAPASNDRPKRDR